jgi:hypothetical protein
MYLGFVPRPCFLRIYMNCRHLLLAFPFLLAGITPLHADEAALAADTSTSIQPAFRHALIDLAAVGQGPLDADALAKFKALLRQNGWPTVAAAGRDGVNAAGKLLVRSSDDYEFQKACIHTAGKRVDIDTSTRALMMISDKVEIAHSGRQQASTLFKVRQRKVVLAAPSAPQDQANFIRGSVGLPSVAEDITQLQSRLEAGTPATTLVAMLPLATATRSVRLPALQSELDAMAASDQTARNAYIQSGMKAGSPQDRAIASVDAANLKRLKAIFAANGFPDHTMVGRSGVQSAWLLVQHAISDKAFMAKALNQAKPLMLKGDLPRSDYALLTDRVRLMEGKPQVYGSQLAGKPGHYHPDNLEDPSHVDQRRARMGMQSLASYIKNFNEVYTPKPGAASSAEPARASSAATH